MWVKVEIPVIKGLDAALALRFQSNDLIEQIVDLIWLGECAKAGNKAAQLRGLYLLWWRLCSAVVADCILDQIRRRSSSGEVELLRLDARWVALDPAGSEVVQRLIQGSTHMTVFVHDGEEEMSVVLPLSGHAT